MVALTNVVNFLEQLLQPTCFKDYCPNGLQVEANSEVTCLVTGVTASLALIEAAAEQQANGLLVHHGYFWRGENPCITGVKGKRIQALISHRINLMAYHLPLDSHPIWGNNTQLAKLLGIDIEGVMHSPEGAPLGLYGKFPQPLLVAEFSQRLQDSLGRAPCSILGGYQERISRIAWSTGAAQDYLEYAAALGVDAYLTGEIAERTVHLARELGIHFFAAGHHATERYGVKALGEHLAQHFNLEHTFIDIPNPI